MAPAIMPISAHVHDGARLGQFPERAAVRGRLAIIDLIYPERPARDLYAIQQLARRRLE